MQAIICTFCSRRNRIQARYCGSCGRPLSGDAHLRQPLTPGTLIGPDGRYAIQDLIGKGGFGEAYLAEDTHHWRRLCLVKRLWNKTDAEPELARLISANFEREAHLLVALNHPGHPNIPDIYEYLPVEQCLVMKFITGQSLDRLLKRRTEPLPEAEALRYIRDACAALVYMHNHTAGPIMHRDLKPSNIMLDTNGRVWLIDFGLARSTPVARPAAAPSTTSWGGTYGYMPPEQQMGRPEPRSDIFALGATLYELVTSRRPPRPGEAFAPARQISPALRPEVDQVIRRCLAPDPAERPQAAELLAILEELLAAANIPAPPDPAPLPDLPAAVGRAAELHELAQRIQTARFVALIGMPGVGKTTLAVTYARRHPRPDAVFWHRFHPGEGVDRLIAHLAGWLAHRRHPAVWQQLQRNRQAGQALALELQADYLAQSPGMQGSLLCFDDVHAVADNPAIQQALDRLRQAAGAGGPALLLTTRTLPGFVDPAASMRLQGLAPAATGDLLARRGLQLDAPALEQLWRVTEGNPQFLTLAIYALQQAADPHALLGHLPETEWIEQYLLREVDERLTESERAVMSAVAGLLGYGGARGIIEAMLDGAGVRRELAALTSRQLLTVEQRETGAHYYQHAIVQAFYYDLPGARQRREQHRRAGAYYEQIEPDRVQAARHYARAGDEQRAAELLAAAPWELFNQGQAGAVAELAGALHPAALAPELRAALWTAQGEAAELLGKEDAARALLEQALAAAAAAPVRQARRYRLLARLYERRGDHAQAETHCRQGLALAAQPDESPARTELARLYAQLAEILMRRDERAGALDACYAGLEALPPEPAAPAERAALLQRLATLEGNGGAYEQAITALEQSLGLARQAGDQALTAQVLHNLGHFCSYSGRGDEAAPYLQESLQIKERLGDRASVVDTLNTLGLVQLARGEGAAALHYFQTARDLAERYRMRAALACSLHNIGQLHFEAGDLAAAEASLSAASAIFAELGEAGEQVYCLYLLGDVALARDDAALALAYGQQALATARQTERQPLEACALRVIGEAHLAHADLAAATMALDQAWALAQTIGDQYDQALILGASARLALARNDRAQARQEAQQSLELARAHAIAHLAATMEALLRNLDAPA